MPLSEGESRALLLLARRYLMEADMERVFDVLRNAEAYEHNVSYRATIDRFGTLNKEHG
jgi:hypothetical protein